jgi:hypothetical protein
LVHNNDNSIEDAMVAQKTCVGDACCVDDSELCNENGDAIGHLWCTNSVKLRSTVCFPNGAVRLVCEAHRQALEGKTGAPAIMALGSHDGQFVCVLQKPAAELPSHLLRAAPEVGSKRNASGLRVTTFVDHYSPALGLVGAGDPLVPRLCADLVALADTSHPYLVSAGYAALVNARINQKRGNGWRVKITRGLLLLERLVRKNDITQHPLKVWPARCERVLLELVHVGRSGRAPNKLGRAELLRRSLLC